MLWMKSGVSFFDLLGGGGVWEGFLKSLLFFLSSTTV